MVMLKRVWSKTNERWIRCNWQQGQCTKDGYENFKFVVHDHSKLIPCHWPAACHINYIFCCELHRDYYANSHISLWNLPPGAKKVR